MSNLTQNSANNSTGSDVTRSPAIYVLAVVVSTTALASILGNMLVQVAYWTTSFLKASSPATLVMLLALVDLCMAVFVMPFVVITALHDEWFSTRGLCIVSGFGNTLLTALQFGILFIISINRFAAVSHPHRYQQKWTVKLTFIMIAVLFAHSLLWSLMPFFGWGGYNFTKDTLYCNINWSKHKAHSTSLFAFCYIIPALIAGILYIVVYVKIRKLAKGPVSQSRKSQLDLRAGKIEQDIETSCSDVHGKSVTDSSFSMNTKGKKIHGGKTSMNSVIPSRRYRSRESRVTQSLLVVAVAFAIFWLPRGLVNFWAVVSGRHTVPKALEYLTTVFIFMNSFVNPIIYGLFHYEYNKAFRRVLRCNSRCATGV